MWNVLELYNSAKGVAAIGVLGVAVLGNFVLLLYMYRVDTINCY